MPPKPRQSGATSDHASGRQSTRNLRSISTPEGGVSSIGVEHYAPVELLLPDSGEAVLATLRERLALDVGRARRADRILLDSFDGRLREAGLRAEAPVRGATLTLYDDPETSSFLAPPEFKSGGGGLCSTAADYLTFCRALLNRGELGGVRLLGPKTLALMTSNHLPGGRDLPDMSRSLFSEATYNGIGFGLGFSVTMNPVQTLIPGSPGEYSWGGAATTSFWIDPAEELIAIFMTQVLPSSAYPLRRELRTMVYAAITDSNL